MTDISELIEGVRGATGPDRKLDADLLAVAGWKVEEVYHGRRYWTNGEEERTYFDNEAPKYTGSVDTALALVERCLPGWRISIYGNHMTGAKGGTGWRVQLQSPKKAKPDALGYRWPATVAECFHATTAPLAILLALLTALQSQGAS